MKTKMANYGRHLNDKKKLAKWISSKLKTFVHIKGN